MSPAGRIVHEGNGRFGVQGFETDILIAAESQRNELGGITLTSAVAEEREIKWISPLQRSILP